VKFGKIILLLLLLAGVGVALLFLPFHEWGDRLEGYVQSLGAMGPIVAALIYAGATVLFVPGSALSITAGALFGLRTGFLVAFTGANLGALLAFVLGRTYLRNTVVRWAGTRPKFRALDRAIAMQGFKMALLARLSPAFPFALLNYLLGLTAIGTGAYVAANLIGMLPGAFLYIYIGAGARETLYGIEDYGRAIKYVGLIATIALVVLLTRIARKALRQNESEMSEEPVSGGI
jgi:uncharacterized membrane protein YdjX (TVP38/TMEM64 family)